MATAASTPVPGSSTLARFDDGQPALLERRIGTGRVLMWTSTLDTAWTDLALKPVFVPFVHRIVRYLGAYREPRPWRTVGDVVDPGLQAPAEGVRRLARRPDAGRHAHLARRRWSRGPRAGRAGILRVPGAGTGCGCAGGRGEQRRSGRVGPDAARSPGDCGGGARTRGWRHGRTAGAPHRTMRRNRPSASGGICCLPGCCCSAPKLSWPIG